MVTQYAARAANFANEWNPNTTLPDGPADIVGFMQPRRLDGTFDYTDPRHCSVNDPTHSTCFLDVNNHDGFYEGSPMLVRVPGLFGAWGGLIHGALTSSTPRCVFLSGYRQQQIDQPFNSMCRMIRRSSLSYRVGRMRSSHDWTSSSTM